MINKGYHKLLQKWGEGEIFYLLMGYFFKLGDGVKTVHLLCISNVKTSITRISDYFSQYNLQGAF